MIATVISCLRHLVALAEQRDAGSLCFFDLGCGDQELLEEYNSGKAERILCSVQAARTPVYRGMHVEAFT